MKKEEKIELGKLLDRFGIKSLFYEEASRQGGVYHFIRRDEKKGNLFEDEICGEDLE